MSILINFQDEIVHLFFFKMRLSKSKVLNHGLPPLVISADVIKILQNFWIFYLGNSIKILADAWCLKQDSPSFRKNFRHKLGHDCFRRFQCIPSSQGLDRKNNIKISMSRATNVKVYRQSLLNYSDTDKVLN